MVKCINFRGCWSMNPLKQLRHECQLIDNALDELTVLETFEGADYSDVVTDLK